MWRPNISVNILGSSQWMMNVLVYPNLPHFSFLLSLAYCPTQYYGKCQFWDSSQLLAASHLDSWLLLGDFNSVVSQKEKKGGRPIASSSNSGLKQFIYQYGLIDMSFNGNPFTWNNGHGGCSNIHERLDKGPANHKWRVQYPNASILHSSAIVSDHLPLILNMEGLTLHPPCSFKFEPMWVHDLSSFFYSCINVESTY